MTSVILGARTLAQLDDNLAAATGPLDSEETRLLDEASEPDTPDYPYGEKGQPHRRRSINPDPVLIHRAPRRPALPDGERGPT